MQALLQHHHHNIVEEVRGAMFTRVLPHLDEIENGETIPEDIYRYMAEAGWYGISIPRRYEGRDLGHLSRLLMIEEASRTCGAVGGALHSAILGTSMVQFYGSEMQKRTWLPRFADGREIISICITEPGSGSHILGLQTTAQENGNDYVLNGTKCWIANSHIATVHGVIARTGQGSTGLSAFLVEANRVGVRPGKANDSTGLRGFNIGEVIFENCRIPASNLIGHVGMGLEIAHHAITNYGKTNLAAIALGIHQAIFDSTLKYTTQRSIYGKPLSDLESARLKIGDIYTRLKIARQSAYWAMYLLDHQGDADEEIILAKLIGVENAFTSAKTAMDIYAARGTSREIRVERYLRDLLMLFPSAGTSDVHRKRLSDIAMGTYTRSVKGKNRSLIQHGVT